MKKYYIQIILIGITVAATCCGCGRLGNASFLKGGDQAIADEAFETLIEAVESGDSEAIKEMFAEDALEQIDDIDAEIEDFIEFYEGTMTSSDDWGCSSSISSCGEDGYYRQVGGFYKVETTEGAYRIKFTLNESAPEESHEGIYDLGIIEEDSFEEKWKEFGSDMPGIYIVE